MFGKDYFDYSKDFFDSTNIYLLNSSQCANLTFQRFQVTKIFELVQFS